MYSETLEITKLTGLAFVSVARSMDYENDAIVFTTADGKEFVLTHSQDCCENVSIEDITGDLQDLVDTPIIKAEQRTNNDNPKEQYTESHTWTFYHFATLKGYVDIRWYGESNGYYSEDVTLYLINKQ